MGYEKDIFGSLRMNSNPHINHGESRVYHQFRRNCISSKRSFVYHHCEKKYSLRLMIYTFGDEMHACAWWYTIAFAMDKKSTGRNLSIFGGGGGNRTRVQKSIHTAFSGCRRLLKFPRHQVNRQTQYFGIPICHDNGRGAPLFTFTAKSTP